MNSSTTNENQRIELGCEPSVTTKNETWHIQTIAQEKSVYC